MRGKQFAAFLILVMNLIFLCTACQSVEDAVNGSADAVNASESAVSSDDAAKNDEEQTVESYDNTTKQDNVIAESIEVEVLGLLREEGRSAILVDGNRFENASAVYEADIDHDGEDEYIVVERFLNVERKGGVTTRRVSVLKNQQVVWVSSESAVAYFDGLFLYTERGTDYLLAYQKDSRKTYRFLLFSLEENALSEWVGEQPMTEAVEDYGVLVMNAESYWNLPLDGENAGSFVEAANELLSSSTLLYWDTDAQGHLSAEEEEGCYTEDLSEVFTPAKNYEDCQSIQEKAERLNQLMLEKMLPDGELPETLKNLSDTIGERIAPYIGEAEEKYAEIAADREHWFEDYNGEKLQMIENQRGGIDIIYYQADEGETASGAAAAMLEALYEWKMNQPADSDSGFKLTDYAVVDQNLRSTSSGMLDPSSDIIGAYCNNKMKSELATEEEVDQWIDGWLEERYGENSITPINPLPEDMWLFTAKVYYKYEGRDLIDFVHALVYETAPLDGMVSIMQDGGEGVHDYLLVKSGDVYRLQRANDWGEPEVAENDTEAMEADSWREAAVHEADVDHDGEDESLIVEKTVEKDSFWETYDYRFRVEDNGVTIYEDKDLLISGNCHGSTYMLYTENDVDYLIKYWVGGNFAWTTYQFTQFYLDENREPNQIRYMEMNLQSLVEYSADYFPFQSENINGFLNTVNPVLESSLFLCGWTDFGYAYSTESSKVVFHEDLSGFWSQYSEADYTGCETVEQKVEAVNEYLAKKWFTDGQLPEMPEEFKSAMAELIAAKKPAMTRFKTVFSEERSAWFADYNGEKLQIVEPEYESTSPVDYPGRIYYRADAGETPEEAAKIMAEAMVQRMIEDSQGQEFVITKYRIGEQELTAWDDIVEDITMDCWEDYLQETKGLDDNLMSYAEQWVSDNYTDIRYNIPLEEDMWCFHLNGYYRYEGTYKRTYEVMTQWEIPVDGMVEFDYWGGDQEFFLMKYGNVYCMQKGKCWGE